MTRSLARKVSSHNANQGRSPDAHISEAWRRNMLAELIRNKLPYHALVRENQSFSGYDALKDFVPDITIDSVHGKPCGVVEVKMLLQDDSLSVKEVENDLLALIAYKKSIPNLAAYFLVIG